MENRLIFGWSRSIIRVSGGNAIPLRTIDDGVVISRRIVVTQHLTAVIASVDIPTLSIVLSHSFTGIVRNPGGDIIVWQVEQVGKTFLTSDKSEDGSPCIIIKLLIEGIYIVCNGDDRTDLAVDYAVEGATLQNGSRDIADTCWSKANSHLI